MTERDLSWLDDDGQADDAQEAEEPEEEEEDLEAAKLKAESEAGEDEDETALEDTDTGAEALLRWAETKDSDTDADRLFKEQSELARTLSRDYVPEPPPDTTIERAAVAASRFTPQELAEFTESMRVAGERKARAARANQPGYDEAGEPVVVEPPFDPSSLDSASFKLFLESVASGGARPDRVPPGESYESWSKKIDSALGVGAER